MRDRIKGRPPPGINRGPRQGPAESFQNTRSNAATSNRDRADRQALDLADVRFRRDVERLHALGACPIFELLVEIGATYLIRQPIEVLVQRYVARLNPAVLASIGADQLQPAAIHLVEPER
jgi:hypothetical protein